MNPAAAAELRERVIRTHLKDPDLLPSEIAARLGCGLRFVQDVLKRWRDLQAVVVTR